MSKNKERDEENGVGYNSPKIMKKLKEKQNKTREDRSEEESVW
jgi:hypothetical protein